MKAIPILSVLLAFVPSAAIGGEADVKAFLERQLLAPNVPEDELKACLLSHACPMRKFRTVAEWEKERDGLKQQFLEKVLFRGDAAEAWRDAKGLKVEWLDTIDMSQAGYRIKKVRFEILPGMWHSALLYEPTVLSGKVPVVLNPPGHNPDGKATPSNQDRCINLAKRGMLALSIDFFGLGKGADYGSNHFFMRNLDLCGASGIAPFYLALERGIDVLLAHPHADPERVAVTGYSGGGWQTLLVSSLDGRVKLAVPVAGFSHFRIRAEKPADLGDSEQAPNDMATFMDYPHWVAFLAPRPTLLIYNALDDCCFRAEWALPPMEADVRPIWKLYGKDGRLRTFVGQDKGHNYARQNREALYRMLGDFFYPGDSRFNRLDISSESELKTEDELRVPMPQDQIDMAKLAIKLSKSLPKHPEIPADPAALATWKHSGRTKLRELVRAKDWQVEAQSVDVKEAGGDKATFWKLKVGRAWTVPAVEIVRGQPRETVILLADGGRKSAAAEAERLLAAGKRVVAIDPLAFGESSLLHLVYGSSDYFQLTAWGDRPLGVQAGQVDAVARWCRTQYSPGPVAIAAVGPRTSLVALIACAVEEHAADALELKDAFKSLKEPLELYATRQDVIPVNMPEVYCFGLLEAFDIPQLMALAAPTGRIDFP